MSDRSGDAADMTPEQRAALDRAKGKQPNPLRFHNPGRFKSDYRKRQDEQERIDTIRRLGKKR